MKKERVLLGMSGGVDSSTSAILLKNQGYDVIGITMKLFDGEDSKCCNLESTLDAKRVCDLLDIPHYTLNFKEEFKKHVINDFICSYSNCKTPNPCIECNRYLKFGSMVKIANELDCKYIATGHYAKIEYNDEYKKWILKKSNAGKKDQSYVLYNIPSNLLERIKLPLGEFYSKDEIRKIAYENNLKVASKPDSEDICFIPDGNYKKFLEENSKLNLNQGNIVHVSGKILGKHSGLYKYTIGQRKGLGITYKTPLYVIGFNKDKNELIVGSEEDLYKKEFFVANLNWLLFDKLDEEMEVLVKTRYSSCEAKAKIIPVNDEVKVIFDKAQKSITPGQSAVFYQNDIVIGGGKIIK